MIKKEDRNRTIKAAEKYVQGDKLEEAITEYQKLLIGDVQDINIRNIIGDLYVRLDKKDKAIEEFQRIATYYEDKGSYPQAIAIYRKINKLSPEDSKFVVKLADLYGIYGLFSEAKTEYLRVAEILKKAGQIEEVISLYKKLIKLDKEDIEVRSNLAELYKEEGLVDQAIEELNAVAEFKIQNKELKEAEKILLQAKKLMDNHLRTITNLVNLFREKNKKKEAFSILHDALKKDKENIKFLNLLGVLYFKDKNFSKAKEIYSEILSLQEKDINARIKLGRIYIQEGNLDEAFKLYEPLIEALITRGKMEKAIGLLGLILASKEAHLPTLEKLAFIYKSNNQIDKLETVYRVILEEYRERNLKEESLSILKELVKLCPEDDELVKEYRILKTEYGLSEEEKKGEEPLSDSNNDREVIRTKLAKADLYLEQGLVRNARRILEDLKIKYSDELEIDQKIAFLDEMRAKVEEDEIPQQIKEVKVREEKRKIKEEVADEIIPQQIEEVEAKEKKRKKEEIEIKVEEEEKITAADIFAETDIIPVFAQEKKEKKYYNLTEILENELDIIGTIVYRQLKGDTETFEKELSHIVAEFKKGIKKSTAKDDYEIHYNLGIAFMEQDLLEEAIEEFILASKDKKGTVDSYSVLGYCYRKKKDFQEGLKWIEKALELAEKGSSQFFALKYELASFYEEMEERKKALQLYHEIKEWNAEYRDVEEKIKILENLSSK